MRLVLLHDLFLLLLKATIVGASTTFLLIEGSFFVETCVRTSLEAKLSSFHVYDFNVLLERIRGISNHVVRGSLGRGIVIVRVIFIDN